VINGKEKGGTVDQIKSIRNNDGHINFDCLDFNTGDIY
jgi:hypothetical protein